MVLRQLAQARSPSVYAASRMGERQLAQARSVVLYGVVLYLVASLSRMGERQLAQAGTSLWRQGTPLSGERGADPARQRRARARRDGAEAGRAHARHARAFVLRIFCGL